jgi:hypothetical protein
MENPEPRLSEDVVAELLAAIQAVIRKTLRVTLRPADGSQKNQDGLELVNDGWIKLQKRLKQQPPVENPQAYAHLTGKRNLPPGKSTGSGLRDSPAGEKRTPRRLPLKNSIR